MDSLEMAVKAFLHNLRGNTRQSYTYDLTNGNTGLLVVLKANHLQPDAAVKMLNELHGVEWVQHMKNVGCRPATISRRVSTFKNLLRFCALRYNLTLDANKFGEMLKAAQLNPKPKSRRRVNMEKVERMLEYCLSQNLRRYKDYELLRELRNLAFVVTLANTGLRVHESLGLMRGDIDWKRSKAVIIGKGEKLAGLRFSEQVVHMLNRLKGAEAKYEIPMKGSISGIPLFVRYTKKGPKQLTTQTGRDILQIVAAQALGSDYIKGEITPHTLRHYFVMVILRKTGGDIKKAKELARHESITTTEKYTQVEDSELDATYNEIFN